MTAQAAFDGLFGGALIGLGLAGMLVGFGRIAGASGIVAGVVRLERGDLGWRLLLLAGMVATGVVAAAVSPATFDAAAPRSLPLVALAGVLVGIGTRLGNGCTSGHGVCGNSRLSIRSLVATGVFMATGMATAVACGGLLGRAS